MLIRNWLFGACLLLPFVFGTERAAAQPALLWEVPFNFSKINGGQDQYVLFNAAAVAGGNSDPVNYANGYSAFLLIESADANSATVDLEIGVPNCQNAEASVLTTFNSASNAYVSSAPLSFATSPSCSNPGTGTVHSMNGWNGPNAWMGTLSVGSPGPVRIQRKDATSGQVFTGFFSQGGQYVLKSNDVIFMAASANGIFSVSPPTGCSPLANVAAYIDSNGIVTSGKLIPLSCTNGTETVQQQGGGAQIQCDAQLMGAHCNLIDQLPNGALINAPANGPQAGPAAASWNVTVNIGTNSTTVIVTTGTASYTSPNGTVIVISAGQSQTFPGGAAGAVHDFNADAKSDILWRDSSGDVALWLMNGAAVSSSAVVGNVASAWSIVGQRDFDGDGKADILWRDASGDVAVWFMNGAAVSSVASFGNLGGWTVAGTGDFNGDGKGDIVWRDGSGNVALWLMNGAGVSSAALLGSVGPNWFVVGTGDFDGDGKADVLWRDTSGDMAIWFMNGTSVASVASLGTVGGTWAVAGTGDFNGDGKSDILWRDGSGNVAIWLMNGGAVSSNVSLGTVAGWSVAQTGDYNGDGTSDVLWTDANGDVAVWFMNGAAVSSAAVVANVPPAWTIQGAGAD